MGTRYILLTTVLILLMTPLCAQDGIKPIIDVHVHDFTEQTYRPMFENRGIPSPKNFTEYQEVFYAVMEQYNVVKAIVSTIGGPTKVDDQAIIYPGYYANSAPGDTTEFKKMIEAGQLKVFGEYGGIFTGTPISDPSLYPYLAICERYDIPLAVHTGGGPPVRGNTNFRMMAGHPFYLEEVLSRYPKLRIYMMHAGGDFTDEAIAMMLQYPWLHAGLGAMLWVNEYTMDHGQDFLRKAKRYGLLDRVMFGSDGGAWPLAMERSIQVLDSYDFLNEEDKRMIFYDNAVRFFKFTDEELKGY